MNTGQQQQQQEEQKKHYIRMDETAKFEGTYQTDITTTFDLSEKINEMFSAVLPDFEGSIIAINNFGQLTCSLFFRHQSGENVKTIVDPGRKDLSTKINAFNLSNKNRTLELTKATKEALEEFITTSGKGRKNQVNWNQHCIEQSEPTINGYNIYLEVAGIDLNKVCKKIYGAKEFVGTGENKVEVRYDYALQLYRPIGAGAGSNQNFMITIMRLNNRKVEDLARKVGMIPSVGTIPMIHKTQMR